MKKIILILIIISISGCIELEEPTEPAFKSNGELLTMYVLDVGQGDSIILHSQNSTALIDAGDTNKYPIISSKLEELNVGELDYIFLTHHHQDHLGSMRPVLTDYKVNLFVDTASFYSTKSYETLMDTVSEENIPYRITSTGETYKFDKNILITVLNPSEPNSNPNDDSIVLKIQAGDQVFLLMGDYENEETISVDCDVLKVGHHGSRNANSKDFLITSSPDISIISLSSDNSYGLPDEEVVGYLDLNSDLYQTTSGTITVVTDGSTSWVE
jgi:competence protein ComEC